MSLLVHADNGRTWKGDIHLVLALQQHLNVLNMVCSRHVVKVCCRAEWPVWLNGYSGC